MSALIYNIMLESNSGYKENKTVICMTLSRSGMRATLNDVVREDQLKN